MRLIESTQEDQRFIQRAIAYSVADAHKKLEREIQRSSLLAKMRDQTVKFVLGSATVSAGIGALWGKPSITSALAGAAGSAALFILRDWLGDRHKHAAQKALARHYAIWDPDSGENS